MPHTHESQEWTDLIMDGAGKREMDAAQDVQTASFALRIGLSNGYPPVLVTVGKNDAVMAGKKFEELHQ